AFRDAHQGLAAGVDAAARPDQGGADQDPHLGPEVTTVPADHARSGPVILSPRPAERIIRPAGADFFGGRVMSASRRASAPVASLCEAGPGSQPPATANPSRPGVVLLIVVILLALFAVVGLGFMLYAESEATASRIYRESQAITAKNLANIP